MDPLTGKERYLRKSAKKYGQAEIELTTCRPRSTSSATRAVRSPVGQVIEKWLEVADLEATTRQRYESLIRLYIIPTFGTMSAAKLDAELLERFYAPLCRCNRLCSGRARDHECWPLAASTVRQVHFILRAALDRAVRWRYLSTNEATLAEPPAFELREPDPPSLDEVAALLNDAWREPAWGLFLWLTIVSGCRRGEMCALRWTDFNLPRGIMTIERSYAETRDGRHEKPTKTRQKRRIGLDPHTVDLLVEYRAQCEAECAALGVELPRDAFVFSASPDNSTPLLPSTVTQKYRRLAQRVGLRSTRIHALRHYSATDLLAAGVDLRTVAGRLGHGSGGATTLRFYAAWVEKVDRAAAGTIADLIPRPDPTRRTPHNPYEELAAVLRAEIDRGELTPGSPLPAVKELMAEHAVSAGTVNRAIALLKEAGPRRCQPQQTHRDRERCLTLTRMTRRTQVASRLR